MLHVKLDDISYALLLMALGMLGVIVVLLIMVLVMYLMKLFLGEVAPVKHKTNYIEPEKHTSVDSAANIIIQPSINESVVNKEIKIESSKTNIGRPPIEVITAAVAMYLSVEQEARSKTNV